MPLDTPMYHRNANMDLIKSLFSGLRVRITWRDDMYVKVKKYDSMAQDQGCLYGLLMGPVSSYFSMGLGRIGQDQLVRFLLLLFLLLSGGLRKPGTLFRGKPNRGLPRKLIRMRHVSIIVITLSSSSCALSRCGRLRHSYPSNLQWHLCRSKETKSSSFHIDELNKSFRRCGGSLQSPSIPTDQVSISFSSITYSIRTWADFLLMS